MSENYNNNDVETTPSESTPTQIENITTPLTKETIDIDLTNIVSKITNLKKIAAGLISVKGAIGTTIAGAAMVAGTHFMKSPEAKAVDFDKQIEAVQVEKADFESKQSEDQGEAESKYNGAKEAEMLAKIEKLKADKDALFGGKSSESDRKSVV